MESHFFIPHFSEELIAEITAYFKEKYGEDVSHENAERYLDSLAELYGCFQTSVLQGFGGGRRAAEGGRRPAPDLISTHNC